MSRIEAIPETRPEGYAFYGGPLSNFNGGPIRVTVKIQWPEAAGFQPVVVAPTVEHYFQAAKTVDPSKAWAILRANSPGTAKTMGRQVVCRGDWEDIRYDVMLHALWFKFTQLGKHKRFLLATGDQFLYEASPTDNTWGLWDRRTQTWTGQNLLGKALMAVRDELQRRNERRGPAS